MQTRGRVLVVGDSGVGKSSFVHRLCTGNVLENPDCTVGCNVEVKLLQSTSWQGAGTENDITAASPVGSYFVEILDVGCHNNQKISRSLYYSNVNGIILVYDLANSKSAINLRAWVTDLSKALRDIAFVDSCHARKRLQAQAPSSDRLLAGLPVLVVGNRRDKVRNWDAGALPNVFKMLGYDSVNVSSTATNAGDFDRVESFLRHVAHSSASSTEVAYGYGGDYITSGMALP
mmetsp:Transcript_9883/g.18220  ORF Transcript_9883/g.18220 Transcript_9883/m.18220 type:complete len:232 (-) Transcript_9883:1502-2197(-)